MPGAPVGEPGVRLAALRVPALLGGRRDERAGGGADVEQPSLAAGQPFDLAERRREGALTGRELRHVGRVVALGVAGEDQVVAEARVDVLELAAPALDEPVDQQLIARRPEGGDEIGRILRIVARVVDDVGVVGAADGARDGLEEVSTRSHELSKRPSLASALCGAGRGRPRAVGPGGGPGAARRRRTEPEPRAQPPVLGVDGPRFTVDGTPRFLLVVSYFDALRASDATLEADFAWLRRHGIDGVRIFPNWWRCAAVRQCGGHAGDDTLMAAPDGALRPAVLARLKAVLAAAGRHGLIVDLSFARETVRDTQERELSRGRLCRCPGRGRARAGAGAARDDRPPERGLPEPAVRGWRRRRRAARGRAGQARGRRLADRLRLDQRGRGRALHLLRRRRLSARRPRRPRRARAGLARSHARGGARSGRAGSPPRARGRSTCRSRRRGRTSGRPIGSSASSTPRRGRAGPVPRPGPSTRGPRSSSARAVRWRRRWTPTSARCWKACGSASTLSQPPGEPAR